jgi:hypothetical protein
LVVVEDQDVAKVQEDGSNARHPRVSTPWGATIHLGQGPVFEVLASATA